MKIDNTLTPQKLQKKVARVFDLAAQKIRSIDKTWDSAKGTPVVTVAGRYTSRGWTEWTQGFQFGMALLQFDATGEEAFLALGREKTLRFMASHVSHIGVHDHGFNNVSTYGNLRRLMLEGAMPFNQDELNYAELALKVSGAVQAARHVPTDQREPWSPLASLPPLARAAKKSGAKNAENAKNAKSTTNAKRGAGSVSVSPATAASPLLPATGLVPSGYLYSFNGPQSLFADTIRSLRALVLAHSLGHALMGEGDRRINLLHRAIEHAATTARYNVFFGAGRDSYDVRGRVAHESIFNRNDGQFRCSSTQQGYSPFTTWTRGAAWIICGYPEQLEFLETIADAELRAVGGRRAVTELFLETARAASDYYIEGYSALDGVPYWDSGAASIHALGDYRVRPADPYNPHEPVDSSAAAIAAQGFLRLGAYLAEKGDTRAARRYTQAGLTVANTLFDEPYLSTDPKHQGLLLHSVYHRPNGWDYLPKGQKVPCGESSMWGDYHAMELALLIKRLAEGEYYTFF